MGRKLQSRTGPRLNTKNFIKTPLSKAVISIDYSAKLKLLEIEFRDNQQIYHYKNVKKDVYEKLLMLKKLRESRSSFSEEKVEEKYSIGKFVNQKVKTPHDYYELQVLEEME